jgi:hypothetical protein
MGIRARPPLTVRELLQDSARVQYLFMQYQEPHVRAAGGELECRHTPEWLEIVLTMGGRRGCLQVEADGAIALWLEDGDGRLRGRAQADDEDMLREYVAQLRRAVLGGLMPPVLAPVEWR